MCTYQVTGLWDVQAGYMAGSCALWSSCPRRSLPKGELFMQSFFSLQPPHFALPTELVGCWGCGQPCPGAVGASPGVKASPQMGATPQVKASPPDGNISPGEQEGLSQQPGCVPELSLQCCAEHWSSTPIPPPTSPPLTFESHQDALKLGLIFINYKLVGSDVVPDGPAQESQLARTGMLRGVTNPRSS